MKKLTKFIQSLIHPRLLDKYVFLEFFGVFVGTLIMLVGILLISLVMDNMKNFVNSEADQIHSILYILYNIPGLAITVSAPALMFAVCFVIGQFSVNKELVSMMAAGISFYRIVSPIIMFGAIVWLVVLVVNETVARPFNASAQNEMSYILKGMGMNKDLVYQYHVRGKEGFYYIYLYDEKEKRIKGGFNYIKMTYDGLPEYIVSAQSAEYQTGKWILNKVEEIDFDEDLKVRSFQKMEKKEYYFPEAIDYFAKPARSVSEMNFFELGREIEVRLKKGIPYYDLVVERHAVFAMPVMNFIVVIIGAIAGSFTKRSAGVASLGITIVIVLLYYIFYSAGRSLGETGVVPAVIAVWYTPVLFLGITYWLFRRFNL